jgi:hypothetical protein
VLSHQIDALVREHRADLIRSNQFRQRAHETPHPVLNRSMFGRVRRALGRALISLGTRLDRPASARLDLMERRSEPWMV